MLSALEQLFTKPYREINFEDYANVSDVTISVHFGSPTNGVTVNYKLHSIMLIIASDVFEDMISNSDESITFCVNCEQKVFEVFLKCIYRYSTYADFKKLSLKELDDLQNLSKQYRVVEVTNVTKLLLNCKLEINNVLECLYLAIKIEKYKIKKFECFDFISRNAVFVLEQNKLYDLDVDVLREILDLNVLDIPELKVLSILYNYASKHVKKRPKCKENTESKSIKESFQEIIIEKIYDATNDQNFGKLLYQENDYMEILPIRQFLLSNNLINKVRILTVNIKEFVFNPIAMKLYNDREILFICDYLLSSDKKTELRSPTICPVNMARHRALNSMTTRNTKKCNMDIYINVGLDMVLNAEIPQIYTEEFMYSGAMTMTFNYIIWSLDNARKNYRQYNAKIKIKELKRNGELINLDIIASDYICLSSKLVKSVFKPRKSSYFSDKKFQVVLETKSSSPKYDCYMLNNTEGYNIIHRCNGTSMSCIHGFGVTINV